MFLGIVLHAGMTFLAFAPLPYQDPSAHLFYDALFMIIHGFRMQLFFLLAGFFGRLLYQRLGASPFLRQRFYRIGLPLLIGWPMFVLPSILLIFWGATLYDFPPVSRVERPADAHSIPTGHLWFLEFLLILYLAAVSVLKIFDKVPSSPRGARALHRADQLFTWLLSSPLRIFAFVPFTVLCLWNGPIWGESEQPGIKLIPELRAVLHYSLFFCVGWILHRLPSILTKFQSSLPFTFLVAAFAILTHLALLDLNPPPETPNYLLLKIISLISSATYAWAMTFGMTGLFLRFGNAENSRLRYLADASYWCYLAHLPLVLLLQIILLPWLIPGPLKILLIISIAMAILLFLYEYRVRYTWVGKILNGPRERLSAKTSPAPVLHPQAPL